MDFKELRKLLHYISENNGWNKNMYRNQVERRRKIVKYIDYSYDTRSHSFWKITFTSIIGAGKTEFIIRSQKDIEKVYEWLDETI